MGIFKSNQEAIYVLTTENFRVRYDHLEMDWFKDKLMLLKTMILIHIYFQVDRLEDELMREQEKLKGITEELEQTFAEMSGY